MSGSSRGRGPCSHRLRTLRAIGAHAPVAATVSQARSTLGDTWRTWPEVWHLDSVGRWCCCSKGSSLDSVRRFAEHPAEMLACRRVRTGQHCPDNWVVIEPQHPWRNDRYDVTEGAAAFLSLRSSLAPLGANLLDVLVFHQEHRWWSLHELTSGTTAWTFWDDRAAACVTRRGRRA